MSTLYILCGPSGCGKSTWAKQFCNEHPDVSYVSRDNIRMNIIQDGEDYFSHEKKVFREFVQLIALNLYGHDVVADATHLNKFSRRKLTRAIDIYKLKYNIIYVVFNTNLETCLKRNKLREGRACVPEEAISRMFKDWRPPTLDEDERGKEIIYRYEYLVHK